MSTEWIVLVWAMWLL